MGFSHDYLGPFRGPCLLFSCYVPPSDCAALYRSTDTLHASPQLTFFTPPPIAALFHPIALFVIPTNHAPLFPMTSQPLHPTRNAVFILQSTSRWRPAHNSSLLSSTNIAQHYIPIYTAAPRNKLSYSFLQKSNFQHFLGPFPGAPGDFAPHFRIPLLPLHIPKFFPTFDLNSHFLLHGTAKRLNSTLIRPSCTTPRGDQPVGRRHMTRIHPSKRWSLTSTVTPTPVLYSFFSFSPKSMVGLSEGHTTNISLSRY